MTTIKRMNGFMETTHVEGNILIYKRLRVQPTQEVVQHELVTTDYVTEDEWKESVIEDIMGRVAIKKQAYQEEQAMHKRVADTISTIKKLEKEERRKMAPRTTAHRVMDAIGIDRRKVYNMLCEVEKYMK